jgi:hypothetical protein
MKMVITISGSFMFDYIYYSVLFEYFGLISRKPISYIFGE